MSCQNTTFVSAECAATSVGAANLLFSSLIQTLLTAQCAISPPDIWPKDYGATTLQSAFPERLEYDFIVIGSGTAGATVAGRLSEISDWKILVLEAGDDPPAESQIPGLSFNMQHTSVDWNFYSEPENICQTIGRCYWPRGKMLGGSSSMNGMIYVRGNDRDFNDWAAAGNDGWDYKNVLPYFKKFEGNQQQSFVQYKNGFYHNATGPMKITLGPASPYDDVLREAAKEKGLPTIDDINADKHVGSVVMQGNSYGGFRQSNARVFMRGQSNMDVIKNAHVDKILFDENKRAIGVKFTYNDERILEAYAKKEVILSAGAIMSPVILLTSGIGPKEQLKKHKIPIIADLPVGAKNLIDHVFVGMFFAFEPLSSTSPPAFDPIYEWALYKTGPLAPSSYAAEFVDTTNKTGYPDIQSFFATIPMGSPSAVDSFIQYVDLGDNIGETIRNANSKSDISAITVALLKPKSRGSIELNVTTPHNLPIGNANYLTNDEDLETLLRGIKRQASYAETEAFKKRGGKLVKLNLSACDKFKFRSDNYWKCYIKYVSTSGYHQVGTSKMGPKTDPEAVVNSKLEFYGIKGLRQIDAGIMPDITSGNLNAPTTMIGEKGADMIKMKYLKNFN